MCVVVVVVVKTVITLVGDDTGCYVTVMILIQDRRKISGGDGSDGDAGVVRSTNH